jgi:thiol-disulfide isomerase/thioredoxin
MKTKIISLFIFAFTCWSCNQQPNSAVLSGTYLVNLDISPDVIPFTLALKAAGDGWKAEVYNAGEVLEYDEVLVQGDSIKIEMSIFDAQLKAKILADGTLQGVFVKNYVEGYSVPFTAAKSESTRFAVDATPEVELSGTWKTLFTDEKGATYEAVGIFSQIGNKLSGTFLTTLGDYRYLDGNVSGRSFYLSAFDGSHAFLFFGEVTGEGQLKGTFRSGPKYRETFTAERDETFSLPDAYSLTYLKEGYDKLEFSFPDVNGDTVSLSDSRFDNKVVLVQLFGTWCPNCMDETKYLAPWYLKNKERGIEIIGLAYESKADFEYASNRVKKTAVKLGASYPFLIAGVSNKQKAAETLPALNQVLAFPTLIYIDKKGKVRKIHTGFTGPGTGVYYQRWVESHEAFISQLLEE